MGTYDTSMLLHRLEEIRSKGALNAENADRRENLHRLFMYPAMMVPAAQSAIIEVFANELPELTLAIDPFMGSGTALLSCMEFGFDVYGQDINPLAVLLSKVKTTSYSIDELRKSASQLTKHIAEDNSDSVDVSFASIDKWFNKDAQIVFSRIRRAIVAEEDNRIRCFFWILFSETIRKGSNDRTSTFKLHRRSEEELEHRQFDIMADFLKSIELGIADFTYFYQKLAEERAEGVSRRYGKAEIKWGNTQKNVVTPRKYQLLVSSPPYGDNHTTVTYGQASYLPLQWIDAKDIDCCYNYLKTTQEIDRQSLGGSINSKELEVKREQLFEKSQSLRGFYLSIPEDERLRYRKTISFMADFDESLDHIVDVMEDDAYYIWTIGNRFVGGREIPNSKVLQDLMGYRGFNLFFQAERRILNKKQPKKNSFSQTMEKEIILIYHK